MKFAKKIIQRGLQRRGYSLVATARLNQDFARILQDQYVEYLQRFIGGFLEPGNIVSFEQGIREMPDDGAVVEIGAFLGLSTNVIAHLLHTSERKTRFFTCDPWRYGEGGLRSPHFSTGTREFDEWARQVYKLNTQLFCANREPLTYQTTSEEFFAAWNQSDETPDLFGRTVKRGGAISLCYIDGDHSYEATKKDFDNVHPHLLIKGFVVFDDSARTSEYLGVQRAVREVLETKKYRVVAENPNFCLQKISD